MRADQKLALRRDRCRVEKNLRRIPGGLEMLEMSKIIDESTFRD